MKQGKQKQQKRTNTFFEFCNAETGILLCTDVAARGLDIPAVHWIVQFDPPDDPRDYIHRVGRTARAGSSGKSLLFLLPSELGFLRYLKDARVPLNEFGFPTDKVANVQSQVNRPSISERRDIDGLIQLEKLLKKNYYLHQSARDGFRSYLQSYANYSHKAIFNVNKLDLVKVGKAFGFTVPPRVDVNVGRDKDGEAEMRSALKRTRDEFASDDEEDVTPQVKTKGKKSKHGRGPVAPVA